ncbi:uncharacterized protein SAPINGB_P003422 [Magnusiomyces paraingens]|uniref:C2H2-type domain-containing protein n=1 Tax=Magnusiomyces paraingens TaxID=2606893 RepID=A0A5E8BUR0_9ASCO|nr:uncharacterized protein SAPINGB_P003422 [Saprochaete ingens]VVT53137.1 unnamed protein product [Saprochaete ingens]
MFHITIHILLPILFLIFILILILILILIPIPIFKVPIVHTLRTLMALILTILITHILILINLLKCQEAAICHNLEKAVCLNRIKPCPSQAIFPQLPYEATHHQNHSHIHYNHKPSSLAERTLTSIENLDVKSPHSPLPSSNHSNNISQVLTELSSSSSLQPRYSSSRIQQQPPPLKKIRLPDTELPFKSASFPATINKEQKTGGSQQYSKFLSPDQSSNPQAIGTESNTRKRSADEIFEKPKQDEPVNFYCHWGDGCDTAKFSTEIDLDLHLRSQHLKPFEQNSLNQNLPPLPPPPTSSITSFPKPSTKDTAAIDNKFVVCNWDSCNLELSEFDSLLDHIKKDHGQSYSRFPHSECNHNHVENKNNEKPLQCLWQSCSFNTGNFDLFDSHLSTHINPAVTLNDTDACTLSNCSDETHQHALKNGVTMFQCEWNSCNFKAENFNDFTSHVRQNHVLSTLEAAGTGMDTTTNSTNSTNSTTNKSKPPFPLYPIPASGLTESHPIDVTSCTENTKDKSYFEDNVTADHAEAIAHVKSEFRRKLNFRRPCSDTDEDNNGPPVCRWLCEDPETGQTHECGETFADPAALTAHVSEVHVGFRKSQYVCQWAGCSRHSRPFAQRQKMTRHMQTHTKNKPYRCNICGNCFAEDAVLRQHMRIHSGEKPFECKVCGKKFTASTALSVHLRTHTGEKPLMCKWPGCGKRFSESSNLTKHMKTHMADRPFACSVEGCGKRFGRNDQLQRHLKTHEKRLKKELASAAAPHSDSL